MRHTVGYPSDSLASCWRISLSKVDRFTSNKVRNDQRLVLHISSNTFHQRKCFVFLKTC